MTSVSLGRWEPLSPQDAAQWMAPADCFWAIAGGWALDLHLGEQTREHADLDILVLRRDQWVVQVKSAGVVYEVDPSVGRVGQAVRA
ncbi:nucleotidyltransferase domain-containing protein [Arsenicicoccus sp. oral taxon 190]|uniref:nucleotidyltransferase domain-containing protein n=1 Tax=Arsenicicoccus sp. oral taxon 190 TaxID=1658671 RepID=UPI000679F8F0|nr:hypothetical protein [Arsenicicoccus sp. oral taxon 190]AKT51650.1 hypothetical protein ADJ73_10770 [Arsenicicoccus sp. oral taxon 190]